MTPEQALQLLAQVTSQVPLIKPQHVQIDQALAVLWGLMAKTIDDTPQKPEKAKIVK